MSVLEQIGEWIAGTRGETELPEAVRQRLPGHLLDSVGAWIAGRANEEGQKLARLDASPNLPFSLLTRQPLDQIALGVATTRLTEMDDIHMASCTTPGSVAVPTAVVVAAYLQKQDANNFARALSAGYEVMTRFGVAISGASILHRGIWPTYFAAPLCAAAVTARLMQLTPAQTANALGIALTLASGGVGRPPGLSPRWLLAGLAARSGCAAALAAAEGYAGDLTLLDSDWMTRVHGIPFDGGALTAPITGAGAIGAVSLKPYCAAKQTIAAIDAFRDILSSGVELRDILAVEVRVPPAYAEMIGHHNAAGSRVGRITSVAYQLALAAHRPAELENIARPNFAADPEVARFMGHVSVTADNSLESYYPQRWPAFVEVVLKNSSRKASFVLDAPGDPIRSGELDARAKFHRLANPVLGTPAAAALEGECLAATEQDRALMSLCARMKS